VINGQNLSATTSIPLQQQTNDYLDGLFDFKYFRLRANSITSYEHIIKVPASVTLDDIQKLEAKDHTCLTERMYSDTLIEALSERLETGNPTKHMEIDQNQMIMRREHATKYSLEDLKIDKEEN
jgi:hypothetical protein